MRVALPIFLIFTVYYAQAGITCANIRCAGPCTDTPKGPVCGPRPASADSTTKGPGCALILCSIKTLCRETKTGGVCEPINTTGSTPPASNFNVTPKPETGGGITCANIRCAGPCTDTPKGPVCGLEVGEIERFITETSYVKKREAPETEPNPCFGYRCPANNQCVLANGGPKCVANCGSNEFYNICGKRCEGKCETAFSGPVPCLFICDPGTCSCKEGFYRQNGICVAKQQCRKPLKCAQNEVENVCGAYCEPKCEDIGKGPRACILICGPPACVCKKGMYRNSNGDCVVETQCKASTNPHGTTKKPTPACPANEHYSGCGALCEAKCTNAFSGLFACPAICAPGACACDNNYYRQDGKCVPKNRCRRPPTEATTQRAGLIDPPPRFIFCPANSTMNNCGSHCESKCTDLQRPSICTADCRAPACACDSGYYRVPGRNCVIARECPMSCPAGEVINSCGSRCEPDCQNAITGKPKACVKICDPPACVCREGLFREKKGENCVSKQTCTSKPITATHMTSPHLVCGDNEEISQCGNLCENKCKNIKLGSPVACIEICKPPACACKKGFYREEATKKCVSGGQCPNDCGENQYINECSNICEKSCSNLGQELACRPFCSGSFCHCNEGFYRNADNKCVTARECPLKCPLYEQLNSCGSRCEADCNVAITGKPRPCPKICDPPACVCLSGFYRKTKGEPCVLKDQCANDPTTQANPYKK